MPPPLTIHVSSYVRAKLRHNGHTQADLGHVLGISQDAVSRRLAGTVPFNTDELSLAAQYLELPLDALFGLESAAA